MFFLHPLLATLTLGATPPSVSLQEATSSLFTRGDSEVGMAEVAAIEMLRQLRGSALEVLFHSIVTIELHEVLRQLVCSMQE